MDSWSDTAVPRYLLNGLRRGTAVTTSFSGEPACRLLSSGPVLGKPFTTVGYRADQMPVRPGCLLSPLLSLSSGENRRRRCRNHHWIN